MTTDDAARRADDALIAELPSKVRRKIDRWLSAGVFPATILLALRINDAPDTPGGRAMLRGAEAYLARPCR